MDVIIVGRGGGSREDLWTFNHEGLVRAIAASRIPIISAVGHEIDVTLADLVADRRALTPTEAGELAVPLAAELQRDLSALTGRLDQAQLRRFALLRRELEGWSRRPGLRLFPARFQEEKENLDLLHLRAMAALRQKVQARRQRLEWLGRALDLLAPSKWVRERRGELGALLARAERAVQNRLGSEHQSLLPMIRALEALNPLAVLARGFAVVWAETPTGPKLVRGAREAPAGTPLRLRWAEGAELNATSEGPVRAGGVQEKGAKFEDRGGRDSDQSPTPPPHD